MHAGEGPHGAEQANSAIYVINSSKIAMLRLPSVNHEPPIFAVGMVT
jgi:hypothetical protein